MFHEQPRGFSHESENQSSSEPDSQNESGDHKKSQLSEWLRGKTRMVVFGLLGFVGPGTFTAARWNEHPKQPSIEETETKPESELPGSVEQYLPLLGLASDIKDGEFVEIDGEKINRKEVQKILDEETKNAFKTEAGAVIANSCADTVQCYLFYDKQVAFTPEAVEALEVVSGMSKEELAIARDIIQNGYLMQPGIRFPGSMVKRDEVGYGNLPSIMSEAEKQSVFEELYRRHLQMVKAHIQTFSLHELPPETRRELIPIFSKLITNITEAETAAKNLDVVYANHKNYRLTKHAEAGRLQERKELIGRVTTALLALLEFYEAHVQDESTIKNWEVLRLALVKITEREEHAHLLSLYKNMERYIQESWTTRGQAETWGTRVSAERAAIADIDRMLNTPNDKQIAAIN